MMFQLFQLNLCYICAVFVLYLCNVYCFSQTICVVRAASELCEDERDASTEEFRCGAVLGAKFKV